MGEIHSRLAEPWDDLAEIAPRLPKGRLTGWLCRLPALLAEWTYSSSRWPGSRELMLILLLRGPAAETAEL